MDNKLVDLRISLSRLQTFAGRAEYKLAMGYPWQDLASEIVWIEAEYQIIKEIEKSLLETAS